MTTDNLIACWVCTDCYFAHHYGAHSFEREATDSEIDHHEHELGNTYHARQIMGLEFFAIDGTTMVREWFAGDSDTRCEGGEPLRYLYSDDEEGRWDVFDWTCSDHYYGQTVERTEDGDYSEPCLQCGGADDENGIEDFSWRSCSGCHSPLGGSRYRLAIHPPREGS